MLSDEDEARLRHRLAAAPGRRRRAAARRPRPRRCRARRQPRPRAVLGAAAVAGRASPRPSATSTDFDEDRVLLDSAVKGSDGFFTTFFVSPYSKYIARWARAPRLHAQPGHDRLGAHRPARRRRVRHRRALGPGRRRRAAPARLHHRLRRRPARALHAHVLQARRLARLGVRPHQGVPRVRRPGDRREPDGRPRVAARRAPRSRSRRCATWPTSRSAAPSARRSAAPRSRRSSSRSTPRARPPRLAARAGARPRRPPRCSAPLPDARARRLAADRPRDRGVRWIKKMIAFPIGERFAVISITAALFTPRVDVHRRCSPGAASAPLYTPDRPGAAVAPMTAAAITATPTALAPPDPIAVYRDDGPLARALGRLCSAVPCGCRRRRCSWPGCCRCSPPWRSAAATRRAGRGRRARLGAA